MVLWKDLIFVLAFLHGRPANAENSAPLALHHLYEVTDGDEVVISLRGHDLDGDRTTATVTSLPRLGSLFQLSQLYDTHGYDPKAGTEIAAVPASITGKDSRVVYRRRPSDHGADAIGGDDARERDADEFEYTVNDGIEPGESLAGKVTLVSATAPSLVSSDFRSLSDEGWKTTGNNQDDVVLHHLYEVANGAEVVVSLGGRRGPDGDETTTATATITALPRLGSLFQLSPSYDARGHDPFMLDPIAGAEIAATPAAIAGREPRVVYRRPFDYGAHAIGRDYAPERDVDEFEYAAGGGIEPEDSMAGKVTLVSETARSSASSDFLFADGGRDTTGEERNNVRRDPSRRGENVNVYIYANDDLIDVDSNKNDRRLWKFVLPAKFTGWYGAWYGGTFEFTLFSSSGDYSGVNDHWADNKYHPLNLVEIHCESCDLFRGVTIAFPLSKAKKFDGRETDYSLEMTESSGWVEDPENTLFEWSAPMRCTFIEVLSGISSVRILGDFTNWYESVSVDNVRWVPAPSKGRYQIPVCAQDTPNCRKCSC